MTEAPVAWFAAKRDNMFILGERRLRDRVFGLNPATNEFSILRGGKKVVFGQLLKVDMSPEALLEDLDIREGDRLLLLPTGSGAAE